MKQSRDDLVKYRIARAYESIDEAKLLANSGLFNKRQEGDYQDFQFFDEETIQPLIEKTSVLINTISKLSFDQ
jgi:uncharacterized protein (UPF0332 family)